MKTLLKWALGLSLLSTSVCCWGLVWVNVESVRQGYDAYVESQIARLKKIGSAAGVKPD